ncbi:hypothetical protein [Paenibacillus arenilitoris]|uniref:Uncharacterized protein n=1 Tax=Paenibacillus arenilitoris TaxID=2772299 RepID=A0A927H6K5_9BACL|nr:hypothetical protein [Paenibacillus arenilitoris]MBD2870080.1 hypothetical protein [Paenibacillus arenilitoris]
MAAQYAFLAVWVIGMFGFIGIVLGAVAKLVAEDTLAYDEQFVWGRKVPADRKKTK